MVERILITEADAVASTVVVGVSLATLDAADLLPGSDDRRTVAILAHAGSTRAAADVEAAVRRSGLRAAVRQLPDREAAKTLSVAETTYLWLNDLGLTRYDTIVGVGGGALTDLAGFVGATYLRGVEVVLVPTTLLGAVDAAIGGKTAVNVGGKNLAGVFRHPARVLIDPDLIERAPRSLLIEGTAEALKAGLIADPGLVELYERDGLGAPLHEVITRAARVKAAVVSEDFREGGRRGILNYGHTVGHAIESATGIPHGHAVAIGMVAAAAASERVLGFTDSRRQRDLIERLELPVQAPDVDGALVRRLMDLDKKRDAGGLRMVLLERVGSATVRPVDAATVQAALEAVGVE